MKYSALPWLVALIVIAAAAWIVREQRNTNQQVLSALNHVKASIDEEAKRSRDLEQQVAALSDHVADLERDIAKLQEQVRTFSPRPVALASAAPSPLAPTSLAPYAPYAPVALASEFSEPEESVVIETLPVTWATDWRSFQPAGIIAPPAPIVIERRLADPAFLKKLYVGYAALQLGDIITTTTALGRGAREGNPLIRNIARSPAALVGVKAAGGVAMVIAIEKLREKHPVAASVTLIAINATMAAVTINNMSIASR